MNKKESFIDRLSGNLVESVVIICSLSILCLMLFLVISRYIFGWSVVGVLELVMIFGIWLYMFGALAASRKNDHLVVDLLPLSLKSETSKAIHGAIVAVITAIICIFFMYWSYKMIMWGMRRPQVTPGLSIPLWVPQSAILVASVGSFIYSARDVVKNIKALANSGAQEYNLISETK